MARSISTDSADYFTGLSREGRPANVPGGDGPTSDAKRRLRQHVAAGRTSGPQRQGYRNGTKPRRLNTRVGELELAVPQVRGCEPYHPSLFAKWQRSERALLVACAEMYFQGVSTRNVRSAGDDVRWRGLVDDGQPRGGGTGREAGGVPLARLDQTTWPYLMIDARYEKVRVEGRVVSQAVLVVVGFTDQGSA